MNKDKSVIKDEIKQTKLKKELRRFKKKIPYSILLLVCFSFVLVYLIEGKIYKYLGDNYNLILVISIFLVSIVIIYMITIIIKMNSIKKEIKLLGERMYQRMKLQ